MKILVTGASGFLGSALVRHLDATPLSYRSAGQATVASAADAVIHCAHDFSPGGFSNNLALAKALLDAPRVIYLTSCSAVPHARSEYGRTKYAIERLFLEAGHTVVRPGLVIGPGGLFLRGAQIIRRSRAIPLVAGGRLLVPVVALADFLSAMPEIVAQPQRREWNLFLPGLVSQRDYVHAINAGARILSVPVPLAFAAFRAAAMLRVPLPLNQENLLGILDSQDFPFRSDLETVVRKPLSLTDAIEKALSAADERPSLIDGASSSA